MYIHVSLWCVYMYMKFDNFDNFREAFLECFKAEIVIMIHQQTSFYC